MEGLTRKGVLREISFSLRKGEILGITGLVGAGRTELVRAIFGAFSGFTITRFRVPPFISTLAM